MATTPTYGTPPSVPASWGTEAQITGGTYKPPTPAPSSGSSGSTTPGGGLTYDQGAADDLNSLFDSYGLSSLAPLIQKMVQQGMGQSAIVAQLRTTQEYKDRFPGMDELKKQGYNSISESQYLQLEDSYHQALQSAGLPAGFYDSPKDFVGFIANQVDPSELKQRAQSAVDMAKQIDPTQRQLMSSMYGVGAGDLAAYFLDSKRAMPLLQKQLDVVHFASEAKLGGVKADYSNSSPFERLVDTGITDYQARSGFQQISAEQDPMTKLAQIWGTNYSFDDAMSAQFYGNADAVRKKQQLVGQEKAAFSGTSGFNPGVSGQRNTAGSF